MISSDTPFRLRESNSGVRFHRVETPGYPVFREPQYQSSIIDALASDHGIEPTIPAFP